MLQDIVRNGVFYKYAARRYPGLGSFAGVECDNCLYTGLGNILGLGRSLDLCLKCAVKAVTRAQNCIGCPVADAAEYVRTNSVFAVSEDTTRWNSIRLVASEDGVVTGAVSMYHASFATAADPEPHASVTNADADAAEENADEYEDEDEDEDEDDELRYIHDGSPESDSSEDDDNGNDDGGPAFGGGHFFAQLTVDAQGNLLMNGVPVSQLPQDGSDEDGDANDDEDNAVQQP